MRHGTGENGGGAGGDRRRASGGGGGRPVAERRAELRRGRGGRRRRRRRGRRRRRRSQWRRRRWRVVRERRAAATDKARSRRVRVRARPRAAAADRDLHRHAQLVAVEVRERGRRRVAPERRVVDVLHGAGRRLRGTAGRRIHAAAGVASMSSSQKPPSRQPCETCVHVELTASGMFREVEDRVATAEGVFAVGVDESDSISARRYGMSTSTSVPKRWVTMPMPAAEVGGGVGRLVGRPGRSGRRPRSAPRAGWRRFGCARGACSWPPQGHTRRTWR